MAITRHGWLGPEWRPDRLRRLLDLDLEPGEPFKIEEMRDDGEFVLRAEVPGIDPEKDAEVTISDGILHIQVHRTEKTEQKEKGSYRSEFRYGEMARHLALPVGCTEDDVKATYRDGILEVRLPIHEETKPPVTKIPVLHD